MVKRTDKPWIADDGTTHATRREAKAHDEEMRGSHAWTDLQKWFEDALDSVEQAETVIRRIQDNPTEFRSRVDLVMPPAKRARKPKAEPAAAKRGTKVAAE